jgi:protein phosphatase
VEVEFGAASRKSALRTMNEDHYLIMRLGRNQETLMTSLPRHDVPQRFDEFGYAMVVADGVGGTGSGEAASRLALATLVHLVITFGRWNVRIDDDIAREVMARGERFYRGVDSTLLYKSHDSPPELQTTLTAAFSAGQDLFLAHVGHSRAYQVHNRELVRLTRDHTIAEAGRGGGSLLDIASAPRDSHHILTETIGGGDLAGPRIDIDQYRLEDGDRLLLCTNGLSDVVSEDRMADVLRSDRAAGDQCTALVDLAVEAGGVDDVTALVAWYHIPKSDEIPATGS